MKYDSIFMKDEALLFSTTWMILKNVLLREINPKKKDKYRKVSLVSGKNK